MMRCPKSSRIFNGRTFLLLMLAAFLGLTLIACEDDGIRSGDEPRFVASPSTIAFSQVNLNDTAERTVEIWNEGSGDLNLRDISLNDNTGNAFEKGNSWPTDKTLGTDESIELSILYNPTTDQTHGGSITMDTNDPDALSVTLDITTLGVGGELFVDPQHVDFPQVPAGTEEWALVHVNNIGAGPLSIEDILVTSGTQDFDVTFPAGRDEDGGLPPSAEDLDSPPSTLGHNEDPIILRVWFKPDDEQPSHGTITLLSDDAASPEFEISLAGNSGDACLDISESDGIEFGPAAMSSTTYKTLTLRNCSPSADLELYDLEISDDGGGVFSIQSGSYPDGLPGDTHVLHPGQLTTMVVGYHPGEENSHTGELFVGSNDSQSPNLHIPMNGTGVDAQCPIANAVGSIGATSPSEMVFGAPQEDVALDGSGSFDPDSTSLSYEWAVISRPSGSMADVDSPHQAETMFPIDIVGVYMIELTVYDELGLANCDPAIVHIEAAPTEDIHIQLVWETPQVNATYGGPDGNAEIGTDLDLHYVHPDGYWGDVNDSVYWQFPIQNWGAHGQVSLDIDDWWGEAPENLNHTNPMNGGNYRVGVHYWGDKGFGAADATVRVFFGVYLHGEYERRLHGTDNFWYVGNVQWSDNPGFNVLDLFEDTHSLPSADDTFGF